MAILETALLAASAIGAIGSLVGGAQQASQYRSQASAATANARAVMELAELNVEAIAENQKAIVTAAAFERQSSGLRKREVEFATGLNREEIAESIDIAQQRAGIARERIAIDRSRAIGSVRARTGAAGFAGDGSEAAVVEAIQRDAALADKDLALEFRGQMGALNRASRLAEFDYEMALIQAERDMWVIDYNEKIALEREENRKRIVRKQAEVEGANYGRQSSAAKAAAGSSLTAGLFSAGASIAKGYAGSPSLADLLEG